MVAFLRRLPDLSPEAYRRMARGPVAGERPQPVQDDQDAALAACARCHGYDGAGVDAVALPRLDGQSAAYLNAALEAFATGQRASGIMQTQASAIERRHYEALSRHFATAGGRARGSASDAFEEGGADESSDLSEAGRRLAQHGDPERLVPACAACHGPVSYPRAERFPELAGQRTSYLRRQLELFRRGVRGGSDFAPIMQMAAQNLSDHDIAALAHYYGSLSGRD